VDVVILISTAINQSLLIWRKRLKYTHEIIGYLKLKGEKHHYKEVKLGFVNKAQCGSYPDIPKSYKWMTENTNEKQAAYCLWRKI
jgi:hypothetical protein